MAFCLVVAVLLAIPALLRTLDVPGHTDRYVTAPVTVGSYSFLQHEIFEETSDLDLAFLGDSLLLTGVNTPDVVRDVSRLLGRPSRVVTLGWNGRGDDLMFYLLRDLLSRRRVKAVALRMPHREGSGLGRGPHPQSYRWLTACEHDPVQPNLPLSDRLTTYALESIGGLRNLLSLVRPNLISTSPRARDYGAQLWDVGPDHGPFIRYQPVAPVLPSSQLMSSLGSGTVVHADRDPPSAYQQGYVSAILELLQSHHVTVALLRTPVLAESRQSTMDVDAAWANTFPLNTKVIAVSPTVLYSSLNDDQVRQLYFDHGHLNRNGAEFYTATILPALLELVSHGDEIQ